MTCIGKEINLSCKALLKTENTTVIMAKFCISLPLVSSWSVNWQQNYLCHLYDFSTLIPDSLLYPPCRPKGGEGRGSKVDDLESIKQSEQALLFGKILCGEQWCTQARWKLSKLKSKLWKFHVKNLCCCTRHSKYALSGCCTLDKLNKRRTSLARILCLQSSSTTWAKKKTF